MGWCIFDLFCTSLHAISRDRLSFCKDWLFEITVVAYRVAVPVDRDLAALPGAVRHLKSPDLPQRHKQVFGAV